MAINLEMSNKDRRNYEKRGHGQRVFTILGTSSGKVVNELDIDDMVNPQKVDELRVGDIVYGQDTTMQVNAKGEIVPIRKFDRPIQDKRR